MSLRIAPHVRNATGAGRPVVALESTVVTHGLPRPQNLELARRLETLVSEAGAVPATIGVVGGDLVVGLSHAELERLASGGADKASLWNLGAIAAAGADAGTTVAATLHAASRAGVAVFATGGIGGVHERAFDESADLGALARYPVVTVCAGPKSILDAGATLERLESLGVPVLGYRSERLAGFVVPETDLVLASRVDTPEQVAEAARAQRDLGLGGGLLVSNPVSRGLAREDFDRLLSEARGELEAAGIRGRDTTPFLLARLAELSAGATLEVNLRLLEENALLAARVAAAMAALGHATIPGVPA